jgi:hypothetical protein
MKLMFYSACILTVFVILKFMPLPQPASVQTNVVDDFQKLCRQIDLIKLSTEPCAISAWSKTLTLVSPFPASEAPALCHHIVSTARETRTVVADGWSVRIVSPYSAEKALATCTF